MSYATYTATETVAMHADTARELRAPITGSGPLAARFASEGHGLRTGIGGHTYGGVEIVFWFDGPNTKRN